MAVRGKGARTKGATGEREFWTAILAYDSEAPKRKLRREGSDGRYRGYSVEIKRQRGLALSGWYRQAVQQAKEAGDAAAIAFRIDNDPSWRVLPVMTPREFTSWARIRQHLRDEVIEP